MIINKYTQTIDMVYKREGAERGKKTNRREREKSAGIAITSFRLPLQEEADL